MEREDGLRAGRVMQSQRDKDLNVTHTKSDPGVETEGFTMVEAHPGCTVRTYIPNIKVFE